MAENPNPQAKIAFVMWSPFHYYVYKDIVKHLPEAEFVVCDQWYRGIHNDVTSTVKQTTDFLLTKRAHWRVLTELENIDIIKSFFDRYEIIATVHLWPPLNSLSFDDWFSRKKSVRIKYGVGKNLPTFAPWSARFDITLTEGEHSQQYTSLYTESHIIGVPKFDDWFNNNLDTNEIKRIKKLLNPDKKTILYLPTHGALSSLHTFSETICSLSDEYNVLVKLHNHNTLTESGIVSQLKKDQGIFLFDENSDILPLFYLSDIVISDSSSASLETLIVNKPLVILDTTSNKEVYADHQNNREFNGYWHSGGLVYSGSIVEQIKSPLSQIGEIVRTPNELRSAIKQSFNSITHYKNTRDRLCRNLFSFNDGRCGERGAIVIQDFLNRDKPEPPLLGLATRNYFMNYENNFRHIFKAMEESLERVKKRIENYQATYEVVGRIRKAGLLQKVMLIVKYFLKND